MHRVSGGWCELSDPSLNVKTETNLLPVRVLWDVDYRWVELCGRLHLFVQLFCTGEL